MIKLELSLEEINIVLAGLGKLPLEASLNVWHKVKIQAEEQLKKEESGNK